MKQTENNHSVEKVLKIIETLAESSQPMRLIDLSNEVDMSPSTVLRMVNTLVECGYAYQEDDIRRYGLTTRFLHIGQMAADHISVRSIAHSFLVKISSQTGEATCLAMHESDHVRYIDVVEGTGNIITIRQRVGGSAPMHCTGSGKLFLSQYSMESFYAFLQKKGLPRYTEFTLTKKSDLLRDLEACRKRGYAFDNEECELGMRCIAAPILDENQRIIACISISGPTARMTEERCKNELLPLLCSCAEDISQKIRG